ncbi:PREDICTED: arginine/serine-rich protein PNISR-like, partial [Amphimedon queenslandica]|uniref:MIT domain-containing protein n=1 Tax=Amphimedon queenslandica TaxID=400682 RepID=A0A1X7SV08_AMPQE
TLESDSGSSNKSVVNLSPPRKPVDQAERRLSPSSSSSSSLSSNGAYVVQAGKLITQGLEYESTGQLDESFDLFKAGVDVLLNGVQTDMNSSRREAVRQKTAEYLQYAEILQRKMIKKKQKLELNRSESSSSNARPHLLQDFKVVSIIANKVLLTESKHTGQRFVFKVLHKQLSVQDRTQVVRGRIPRSKNRTPSQCPYMVKLLHHYETVSNRIFLLLEHIKNGRLVHHVQSIRDHQLGRRLQEREERRRRKREKKRLREQGEELARIVIGQESSTLSPGPPLSPNVSSESLNMTQSPISLPHSHGSPNQDPPPTLEPKNEDDYIQYLMDNLSPPTELPVTSSVGSSIGGGSGDGDEEDEKEDMLDVLRKQMEELCKEDEEELSSKATREEDAKVTDDAAMLDREDEAEIQAILTGGDGKENDDSLGKEDGSLIEDTNKEDDDLLGDQEQLLELEKHLSAFTSLSAPDNNSDLLQLNLSQDNDNTTTADPTDIVPSSSNDDIHTSTDPPNTSSSNNEDKGSSKPD